MEPPAARRRRRTATAAPPDWRDLLWVIAFATATAVLIGLMIIR